MKIWRWLGYLGVIPFIICLAFPKVIATFSTETADRVFIYYSAIILSFLSGTLWKNKLLEVSKFSLIASNSYCLFAFTCLLVPVRFSLVLLAFGYLFLLVTEYLLLTHSEQRKLSAYFHMRIQLSVVVIVLHIIALLLLLSSGEQYEWQ